MSQHKTPSDVSRTPLFSTIRSLRQFRRARDLQQTFVIEGIRQFIRAHEASYRFDAIIHSHALLQHGMARSIIRRLTRMGASRSDISPEEFRALSTTQHASGVIAIARQRWTPLAQADPHRGPGWIVVEQIRSAGNLGTILRTAEATGMSGVIFMGERAADPYDPDVVRASMGGIFRIPLVRASAHELSVWLNVHGIESIGLSTHTSRDWTDLPPARSHAVLLGEEREGLSPPMRRLCDHQVRLPMPGQADSLNVAVAAGVMMYELLRRRIAVPRA
jgi:TrmH family RNA methyltransferase